MRIVVENTRIALRDQSGENDRWPVLNFQYGYVHELNETLIAYSKTKDHSILKFPLFWVAQPFTVDHGDMGYYGTINNFRAFIIMETSRNYKAEERMEKVFKPIIYPIYWEWLTQLKKSKVFKIQAIETLRHSTTDRYYWGNDQQSVLNDIVDVMEISKFPLTINNNFNCPETELS